MALKRAAFLAVAAGAALVLLGVALIYPPLAVILAGFALGAVGLLLIPVER